MIGSFRRDVHENCTLLGYYTAISGNSLPTLGTTYRSRYVGKELQLLAAY
jgi:hypothetical protein